MAFICLQRASSGQLAESWAPNFSTRANTRAKSQPPMQPKVRLTVGSVRVGCIGRLTLANRAVSYCMVSDRIILARSYRLGYLECAAREFAIEPIATNRFESAGLDGRIYSFGRRLFNKMSAGADGCVTTAPARDKLGASAAQARATRSAHSCSNRFIRRRNLGQRWP